MVPTSDWLTNDYWFLIGWKFDEWKSAEIYEISRNSVKIMISKLLSVSAGNRKAFATKASQIYKSTHIDSRYQINDSLSNFVCKRVKAIPEFNIQSYTFKHKKTGTELWYLQRNDANKVLSVNFRTTPFDSTGKSSQPRILKHIHPFTTFQDYRTFWNTMFFVDQRSSQLGILSSKCWTGQWLRLWTPWLDRISQCIRFLQWMKQILRISKRSTWMLFSGELVVW